jgi:hypothetical protein
MSWGMRVLVWGGILIVLVLVSGWVPKSEHELQIFLALCIVLWVIGTGLWLLRALFRFVVR